jgi:hypothetical protein
MLDLYSLDLQILVRLDGKSLAQQNGAHTKNGAG